MNDRTAVGSRRWVIIGSLVVAGIIVAILAGAAAWQKSVHRSHLDELESHSATASLLLDAGQEGRLAADLLERYVQEGDETLIPQVDSHATAGVESLTNAVGQGGAADLDQIAVEGTGLAEGAGRIIALRQSGDVQGAATALEEISPKFEGFTLGLENAIALELEEVSALQSSADRADDVAFWLRVAAGAISATMALAVSVLIARSLMRRRVPETASPT